MILEALKSWVKDIIIMVFSLAMLEALLPRGEIKKAARIVIGLAIVAVILAPLTKIGDAGRLPLGAGWSPVRDVDLAAAMSQEYIARGEAMRAAGESRLTEEARGRMERQVEALVGLGVSPSDARGGASTKGSTGNVPTDISARVEIDPSSGDLAAIEVDIRCDGAGNAAGMAGGNSIDIERLRGLISDFYGLDRERVSVKLSS